MAKYALGLDAAFCTVGGLVLMLGGIFMSDAIGISGWILPIIGFGVLGWANLVTLYAMRQFVRRPELDRVIGGNLIWIAIAAVLLVVPGVLTTGGKWALVVVTAIVAIFAVVQFLARGGLVDAPEDLA